MGRVQRKPLRDAISPEYSVYIYHHPGVLGESSSPWERKNITTESGHAVREARALYQSKTYPRVEIRKKFFDRRCRHEKDVAWKVYETKPENRPVVGMLVFAGGVCVFIAAGLLYFLF
jgi:hypothetical protein